MLSKTVMVLGSFFLWCMWSETDEKNRSEITEEKKQKAKNYRIGNNDANHSLFIYEGFVDLNMRIDVNYELRIFAERIRMISSSIPFCH